MQLRPVFYILTKKLDLLATRQVAMKIKSNNKNSMITASHGVNPQTMKFQKDLTVFYPETKWPYPISKLKKKN